ncbi:MAG: ATP-binding cassette domain-containing protein [candidate division NC10 bacterium]|nr:ATP-binding cassette domain-containing protein [candidate division NC10 bacterium]
MTAVRLEAIVKRFGETVALDDVSLEVRPRELFTLVGPSGCGKAALLRIVVGLLELDAGHVLFDGQQVDGVPPYLRNIRVLFQNYAIFPHLRRRWAPFIQQVSEGDHPLCARCAGHASARGGSLPSMTPETVAA